MTNLKVIVDQRERNTDLIGSLKERGVLVELKTLPVGDYVISDRLCVERKTIQDFESSIMNGRLFEQIERLVDAYESPILILEDSGDFKLSEKVIKGTIMALYVDYGIQILGSSGPQDTAEILAGMAKREQIDEKREPSMKGSSRAHSEVQYQEFVIGNLPGVGPKLARSLLRHFGSVKKIANASVEELTEVEKIGKKKAQLIHNILNSKYSVKDQ